MAKPGAGMNQMSGMTNAMQGANQMRDQYRMNGPQPQPGESTFGPPSGQMPQMRGPQGMPGGMMGPQTQNVMQALQNARMPNPMGQQGAITANMPMRGGMSDPRMRSIGGMNPVAQAIQRTGADPSQTNTVMNRLRPTMASNQNVQPLQTSNPNVAPQPFQAYQRFRGFGRG